MAADKELGLFVDFVGYTGSINEIGYAVNSVFAGLWYVANVTRSPFCGRSLEDQCSIRQWMEMYCTKFKGSSPWEPISQEQLRNNLHELNVHLSCQIFMCGDELSLADILLYYGIYGYMIDMSHADKSYYVNVSRWFDQVQHYPNLKPFTWKWISFPKNHFK